jgi:hypothetical protein
MSDERLINEINQEADDMFPLSVTNTEKNNMTSLLRVNTYVAGIYVTTVVIIFAVLYYGIKDVKKFPSVLKVKKTNPEDPDKLNWITVLGLSLLIGLIPALSYNYFTNK